VVGGAFDAQSMGRVSKDHVVQSGDSPWVSGFETMVRTCQGSSTISSITIKVFTVWCTICFWCVLKIPDKFHEDSCASTYIWLSNVCLNYVCHYWLTIKAKLLICECVIEMDSIGWISIKCSRFYIYRNWSVSIHHQIIELEIIKY